MRIRGHAAGRGQRDPVAGQLCGCLPLRPEAIEFDCALVGRQSAETIKLQWAELCVNNREDVEQGAHNFDVYPDLPTCRHREGEHVFTIGNVESEPGCGPSLRSIRTQQTGFAPGSGCEFKRPRRHPEELAQEIPHEHRSNNETTPLYQILYPLSAGILLRVQSRCAAHLVRADVVEVAEPDVGAALTGYRFVQGVVNLNFHTLTKRSHVVHSFSLPDLLTMFRSSITLPPRIFGPRSLGRFTPRFDRRDEDVPEGCGRGCSTRKAAANEAMSGCS